MNKKSILVVAATQSEISAIESDLRAANCSILISGIGTNSSTYNLCKYLQNKQFDLILNVGIAGAYCRDLALGQVVQVSTDLFADLGIESQTGFLPLQQTNLPWPFESISADGAFGLSSDAKLSHLNKVKAITCDMAHGNERTIARYTQVYSPDIETMEGAAVAMTALLENYPIIALRAISNYVEPRDLSRWNIPLALKNLHFEVLRFVDYNKSR